MLSSLIQFVLRVLRWLHIDVYAILKNRAERRMWRRALPKDGKIDKFGMLRFSGINIFFRANMKLSIITINYNNVSGLKRTIDSVLSQRWTDFEWIVIDGGSTDGSRELIKEHASHFSYWCSEKDSGIYNAMNKGIRHAKGEYLNFLNSGDAYCAPETLSNVFSRDLSGDIVYGDADMIDEAGNVRQRWNTPERITVLGYLNGFCVNHQASFVRRDVMLSHLYDESYRISADTEFFFYVLLQGKAFQKIDLPVAAFQIGGISGKCRWRAQYEWKRAILAQTRGLLPWWFNIAYLMIPSVPIRPVWAIVKFLARLSMRKSAIMLQERFD